MHHFCSRICTETIIFMKKKMLLQWSIPKLLLLFLGIMHFLELEALHMFTVKSWIFYHYVNRIQQT